MGVQCYHFGLTHHIAAHYLVLFIAGALATLYIHTLDRVESSRMIDLGHASVTTF